MRQCLTNVEASTWPCTEIAEVVQGYAQGEWKKTSYLLPCWSMSLLATDLETQRSLGVRQRAFLLCIASIDCLRPRVQFPFHLTYHPKLTTGMYKLLVCYHHLPKMNSTSTCYRGKHLKIYPSTRIIYLLRVYGVDFIFL